MAANDVLAAGAVVFGSDKRVLLVHRPRYNDWSFPKGKLDEGEHVVAAAVREVTEETGLLVRLGPPLAGQRYPVGGGRTKQVSYWVARAIGGEDVSTYLPNAEIDAVEWVSYAEAMVRLTYERDRVTLAQARRLRRRTHALVVLRHAQARSRAGWRGRDDRRRPLARAGHAEAERLVPVLAAYDVSRVVTSSSVRCVQTVAPFATAIGVRPELDDGLSEEGASAASVLAAVDRLVEVGEPAVVCTHRPVLPSVFDTLGLPDPRLEPAAMLVVHLRRGDVMDTESLRVR